MIKENKTCPWKKLYIHFNVFVKIYTSFGKDWDKELRIGEKKVRWYNLESVHSPRGIVADVHEEILPKWSSATGAVAHAAAHEMRGRPRDLGVMPDFV